MNIAPFAHTTDPDVFYRSPIHESACAELIDAAKTHAGFLVLSGEPGSGKTAVLHRVAHALEQAGCRVFRFSDVGPVLEMFHPLGREPGTLEAGMPTTCGEAFLTALQARLHSEGATVVALDEAQRLGLAELGLLRDLVEAERAAGRRLAVLLVGQPGFDVELAGLEGDRATQTFALRVHLSPLDTSDVRAYMAYRLEQTGSQLDDVFDADAAQRVAAYTQGFPRRINQLCDAALDIASAAGLPMVSASTVDAAAGWLDLDLLRPAGAPVASAGRTAGRQLGARARRAASRAAALWAWSRESMTTAARATGQGIGEWVRRGAPVGAALWAWSRESMTTAARATGRGIGVWGQRAASEGATLWRRVRDAAMSMVAAGGRLGAEARGAATAARRAGRAIGMSVRRAGPVTAALWAWSRESMTTAARGAGREGRVWAHRAISACVTLWGWAWGAGMATVAAGRTAGRRLGAWACGAASRAAAPWAWSQSAGASRATARRAAGRRMAVRVADQAAFVPAKLRAWLPDVGVAALVLAVIALVFALWPTSYQPSHVVFPPGMPLPLSSEEVIERPPPSDTPRRLERPVETSRKRSAPVGTRAAAPPRVASGTPGHGPLAREPETFTSRPPSDR